MTSLLNRLIQQRVVLAIWTSMSLPPLAALTPTRKMGMRPLAKVADAAYPQKTGKPQRKQWLQDRCHQLKHEPDGASTLLAEMKTFTRRRRLGAVVKDNLQAAITYFENQLPLMKYAAYVQDRLPIGSGVTEAACKTLIKQRFCCSGMRWKHKGVRLVLSLRELVQTEGRWEQFWAKIDQYGAPLPE